jgi:hypothetical protein
MHFQGVAFLEVIDSLDDDPTFGPGGHFIHFVAEVAQAADS